MIELQDFVDAFNDVMGAEAESGNGYSLDEMLMRFEMVGVDWDDFKLFVTGRLETLSEVVDLNEYWSRGYIHAAMEFVLYGVLMGKEIALDLEIADEDETKG